MKFFIGKAALSKLLSMQVGIVEKRSPSRILSHILLSAEKVDENSILKITGTDLDISLISSNPVSVQEEGKITVCAHTLHDIVKKLSDDVPISIETRKSDTLIKLSSATSEFLLPTLPVTEFPNIHPQGTKEYIKIHSKDFNYLISRTKFAMSSDTARQVLNGIFFHKKDDSWRAVATDSHRLALYSLDFNTSHTMQDAIVGRKAIIELSKLLDGIDEEIKISILPHQILVSFQDVFFASRLLEGTFPEYQNIIPKDFIFEIKLDVKEFAKCIDRIAMVSDEKNRVIKLTFIDDKLILSAQSESYGSGTEEMTGIEYNLSEPFSINFNYRYILDICNNINGKHMNIKFKNAISPASITDTENDKELYIMMPMRV